MIKVLINAYAVAPNWGSEQGMGWNWIINIAKFCKVFVITEGEWKSEINEAISSLPQKDNIKFFYNPVSENIRKMCWNQGDWRFYIYYSKWQRETLQIAKDIVAKYDIDLIHQLNMVGFREPGLLWKIDNVPFIWGPFCGCTPINLKYLDNSSLRERYKYRLKNIINWLQIRYSPRIRSAFKHASALITTDDTVRNIVQEIYKKDSLLISETGIQEGCIPITEVERLDNGMFNILWVGRFIKTKKLDIALKTISLLKDINNIRLHIIGFGMNNEDIYYKNLANDLGISDKCIWYGKMNNQDVKTLMRKMDIFFFTSVLEATSTVVPEAIQNRLPIVCHDICGFGPLINNSIGRKIPLSTPNESAIKFAQIIRDFYQMPSELSNMKQNFDIVADRLKFDIKGQMMYELYNKIINKDQN